MKRIYFSHVINQSALNTPQAMSVVEDLPLKYMSLLTLCYWYKNYFFLILGKLFLKQIKQQVTLEPYES